MEERLQAEWTTHLPDQAEKEQAISKLATQVEEQVCRQKVWHWHEREYHDFSIVKRSSNTVFSLTLKIFKIQLFRCNNFEASEL